MSDIKEAITATLQGYIDGNIEFNDAVDELLEIAENHQAQPQESDNDN